MLPGLESIEKDGAPSGGDPLIWWSRRASAVVVIALFVFAIGVPLTNLDLEGSQHAAFFFLFQDVYFLPLLLVPLLVRPVPDEGRCPRAAPIAVRGSVGPTLLAASLGFVCWIGHYIVLGGYDLSRDEQMANFDAYIFAHGHTMWPISAAWRPFADALNQRFILPIGVHQAWVSAYLPVNAAFRAAIGSVGDAALTGPLFVVLGALALWRIGLRLWPESPWSRLVALVLYAGSAQVVLTGMTAFAMSAHLGLDLLWLALFLRGGAPARAGTVGIGFLATGLHQPLFHPLFVLPFLDVLRRQRRWRLLAYYLVAYGLIGAFWLAWPVWMSAHGTPAPAAAGVGYLNRLLHTVQPPDVKAMWTMALNLLRFITWQHLLLLPLLMLGVFGSRNDPITRALAIGFVLPVLVMAIILPLQGHGWGYRYLHGVIGNACLLGGYGWRWLEMRRLTLRRPFLWTSAVTVLVVIPAHAVLAYRWDRPYVMVDRAVGSSKADLVVVEDGAVSWGQDLVVNRPDLSNRPIRLRGSALRPDDIALLCHGRSIAFFDRSQLHAIHELFGTEELPASTGQAELEAAARQANCTVVRP